MGRVIRLREDGVTLIRFSYRTVRASSQPLGSSGSRRRRVLQHVAYPVEDMRLAPRVPLARPWDRSDQRIERDAVPETVGVLGNIARQHSPEVTSFDISEICRGITGASLSEVDEACDPLFARLSPDMQQTDVSMEQSAVGETGDDSCVGVDRVTGCGKLRGSKPARKEVFERLCTPSITAVLQVSAHPLTLPDVRNASSSSHPKPEIRISWSARRWEPSSASRTSICASGSAIRSRGAPLAFSMMKKEPGNRAFVVSTARTRGAGTPASRALSHVHASRATPSGSLPSGSIALKTARRDAEATS